MAWKQEIASDGCRQLAEPPDRQMLIAETSNARLRPLGAQFKRPARVLHGVSGHLLFRQETSGATNRNSADGRPTATSSLSPAKACRT